MAEEGGETVISKLEAAAKFYSESPDGQYDKIAEACILHYLRYMDRAIVALEALELPLRKL